MAFCPSSEPCADPATNGLQSSYNPLDPTTFVFPKPLQGNTITIEFCDRCRWLHRATWIQTELLLTFPSPTIECISILPRMSEETAGRFRVWLSMPSSSTLIGDAGVADAIEHSVETHLLWDRKVEGGFPELKVLKQRVRDNLQPGKSLGHSDNKSKN